MASDTRRAGNQHRVARLGVLLACSVVLVQTVVYLVDVYAFDRRIDLFDLEEGGLITWATASATVSVGVVALLLSFLDDSQRWRGAAVAVGTAFISFDDAVILHERVGFAITGALGISDSYMRIVWPSLYAPLLVALAVLLVQLVRDASIALRLVFAGLVGLATAVALEVAGVALDRAGLDQESSAWTVKTVFEEGIELGSWIIIATGVSVRLIAWVGESAPPAAITSR